MQQEVHPSARDRNNQRGDGRRKKIFKKKGFHEVQRQSNRPARFFAQVQWNDGLGDIG